MRAILIGALAVASLAGSGKLDSTFGSHGKVVTALFDGASAQAIALQRDGKLVVAGFAGRYGQTQDFAVARYTPRGRLDRRFGQGGKVTTDFGATDYATAAKVQRDGKIVVVGVVVGRSEQLAVARYRRNGSLDTSFGTGGKVLEPGGGFALALQRDGKILVGGEDNGVFALYRFKPDGSLDTVFGTNGEVATRFGITGLALQPNGKIVAVGFAVGPFDSEAWALARYDRDGSLDTTFGSGGTVTIPPGQCCEANRAEAVVLQGNGRIVAAGTRDGRFTLMGFRPNGTLDPRFGRAGGVTTAFGPRGDANALAVRRDGSIVAAGGTAGYLGNQDFALARLNRKGIPLTGTITSFTDGSDVASGLVVQRDGKVVAAGVADQYGQSGGMFALARYRR